MGEDITIRERTPYHEAGHAVMSFYRRRRILQVSIEPDEEKGSAGHTLNSEKDTMV